MKEREFNPNAIIPDNGNYFGFPLEAEDAALVLISAPWDTTVSTRAGSSYAPDAIIEASRFIDFYEPSAPNSWRKGIATAPIDYSIQDLSHRLRSDADKIISLSHTDAEYIFENIMHDRRLRRINEASMSVNDKIYSQAKHWLERGKIVGLVGGDQSTAYGNIRAMGEYHQHIGVLHIDARCNLKENHYGFTHSHDSIMHNVLRDIEGIDRLVSVGVREFSHAEWERAEQDERIRLFTGQYIWTAHFEGVNWSTIAQEIVDSLPEKVYISLDIDGLTIECSPHTGTTISGGLRFPEVVYLMSKIVASGRQIVGFDLTEVVPDVDDKSDAMIAARLLFKMCSMALKHVECDDVL